MFKRFSIDLSTAQKKAKQNGGRCLSAEYKNSRAKMKWECHEGHRWRAPWNAIQKGHWCPTCGHKRTADVRRGSLEDIQKIARAKGGKILSTEYLGSNHSYRFRCAKGHIWQTRPYRVRGGHWCRVCEDSRRLTLTEMQKEASKRQGLCLSDTYTCSKTKLLWRCRWGHEFWSIPNNVRRDRWCRVCRHQRRTLESLQKLAGSRGGTCVSEVYLGVTHKLDWKCHRGHVWQELGSKIRQGAWCPECVISRTKIRKSF